MDVEGGVVLPECVVVGELPAGGGARQRGAVEDIAGHTRVHLPTVRQNGSRVESLIEGSGVCPAIRFERGGCHALHRRGIVAHGRHIPLIVGVGKEIGKGESIQRIQCRILYHHPIGVCSGFVIYNVGVGVARPTEVGTAFGHAVHGQVVWHHAVWNLFHGDIVHIPMPCRRSFVLEGDEIGGIGVNGDIIEGDVEEMVAVVANLGGGNRGHRHEGGGVVKVGHITHGEGAG